MKGVFVQLPELIAQIQSDQTKRNTNNIDDTLPFNIFNTNFVQEQSTIGMNGQFVHSQLLIDCLIRMKSTNATKSELIALCKNQYQDNTAQLNILDEFEQNYSAERAIWWYTRDSFLYRIMNKALRIGNIDLLFLLRFVIRDLEQQLKQHQCSYCFQLYRGQFMSSDELQLLQNSEGQLISINSFLSTSINREVALCFLSNSPPIDSTTSVIFEIFADPNLENIKPFANITQLSYFAQEQEVLIMLGSIFRIVKVYRSDDQLWTIRMMLCSGNDHGLKPIFEQMTNTYGGNNKEKDIISLSHVLFNMGKYDYAEKYINRLLNDLPEDHEDVAYCYSLLGDLAKNRDDLDTSLTWHSKSLEIKLKKLKANDPQIGNSYLSIGIIYRKKNDLVQAMKSLEMGLFIYREVYGDEHLNVADCLISIGSIYLRKKDYSNAMTCFQKAWIIKEKHCADCHPSLGELHNSMADAHRGLQNFKEALKHARLSLNIFEKSLPPVHYKVAWAYEIMGNVYEEKKELTEALNQYHKAARIYCAALPATHYYVCCIKKAIERVSLQLNS